jgi:hypothetical protein
MARYANMLGKRVEVHYRAGEVTLPATALLVADSGRSIFLEDHYVLRGRTQTFRWEIPYSCILRLEESRKPVKPSQEYSPETPTPSEASTDLRMLPLHDPLEET